MTSVTESDESERRLAEALRARATGAGRGAVATPPAPRAAVRPMRPVTSARTALLIALMGGATLGMLLALLSLLAPGVLPAL
jgi:hypothetical protein